MKTVLIISFLISIVTSGLPSSLAAMFNGANVAKKLFIGSSSSSSSSSTQSVPLTQQQGTSLGQYLVPSQSSSSTNNSVQVASSSSSQPSHKATAGAAGQNSNVAYTSSNSSSSSSSLAAPALPVPTTSNTVTPLRAILLRTGGKTLQDLSVDEIINLLIKSSIEYDSKGTFTKFLTKLKDAEPEFGKIETTCQLLSSLQGDALENFFSISNTRAITEDCLSIYSKKPTVGADDEKNCLNSWNKWCESFIAAKNFLLDEILSQGPKQNLVKFLLDSYLKNVEILKNQASASTTNANAQNTQKTSAELLALIEESGYDLPLRLHSINELLKTNNVKTNIVASLAKLLNRSIEDEDTAQITAIETALQTLALQNSGLLITIQSLLAETINNLHKSCSLVKSHVTQQKGTLYSHKFLVLFDLFQRIKHALSTSTPPSQSTASNNNTIPNTPYTLINSNHILNLTYENGLVGGHFIKTHIETVKQGPLNKKIEFSKYHILLDKDTSCRVQSFTVATFDNSDGVAKGVWQLETMKQIPPDGKESTLFPICYESNENSQLKYMTDLWDVVLKEIEAHYSHLIYKNLNTNNANNTNNSKIIQSMKLQTQTTKASSSSSSSSSSSTRQPSNNKERFCINLKHAHSLGCNDTSCPYNQALMDVEMYVVIERQVNANGILEPVYYYIESIYPKKA